MNPKRLFGAGIALAAVSAAALPASAAAVPVITASGSTSVAPLFGQLAKGYIDDRNLRGKLKFKLAQGGSDTGVSAVAQGKVSIGNSSRDPKSTDSGVVFNRVAEDALCIATHPDNKIGNLTQAQVQAIFSGQVRNWEQVQGATVSGPIDLVTRTPASGTQDAFDKIFMGGKKTSETASAKASNGLIQQTVRSSRNAIGYVSLDFTEGVNSASYQGVGCSLAAAKSGQYGGTRSFYMVTRGPARGAVAKFITWTQKSGRARKIISRGWVPIG